MTVINTTKMLTITFTMKHKNVSALMLVGKLLSYAHNQLLLINVNDDYIEMQRTLIKSYSDSLSF